MDALSEQAQGERDLPIEEVWKRYWRGRKNGDGDFHRNLLMENYRDIVRYAGERLHKKLPPGFEVDDLISDGIFGLMDAIKHFDPERHVKFETYCSLRIRGAMLDGIRNEDYVARIARLRQKQVDKANGILELRLNRTPDKEEILEELSNLEYRDYTGESNARLRGREFNHEKKAELIFKDGGDIGKRVSLSIKIEDAGEDVYEVNPDFVKEENPPYFRMERKEIQESLTKGFTREEKLIILLYDYQEMQMREIGDVIGISESRVSQMHSSIILRLKAQLTLNPELQEDLACCV